MIVVGYFLKYINIITSVLFVAFAFYFFASDSVIKKQSQAQSKLSQAFPQSSSKIKKGPYWINLYCKDLRINGLIVPGCSTEVSLFCEPDCVISDMSVEIRNDRGDVLVTKQGHINRDKNKTEYKRKRGAAPDFWFSIDIPEELASLANKPIKVLSSIEYYPVTITHEVIGVNAGLFGRRETAAQKITLDDNTLVVSSSQIKAITGDLTAIIIQRIAIYLSLLIAVLLMYGPVIYILHKMLPLKRIPLMPRALFSIPLLLFIVIDTSSLAFLCFAKFASPAY